MNLPPSSNEKPVDNDEVDIEGGLYCPTPTISFCREESLPKEIECVSAPKNASNHSGFVSDLDTSTLVSSPGHRRRSSSTSTMTFYSLDGSVAINAEMTGQNSHLPSEKPNKRPKDVNNEKTPSQEDEKEEQNFLAFLNQLQEFSGDLEKFVAEDLVETARQADCQQGSKHLSSTALHRNEMKKKEASCCKGNSKNRQKISSSNEVPFQQGQTKNEEQEQCDIITEIPLSYSPSVSMKKPWPNTSSSYYNEWWNSTTRFLAAIPEEVASVISTGFSSSLSLMDANMAKKNSKYHRHSRQICLLLTTITFVLVALGSIFLIISMVLSATGNPPATPPIGMTGTSVASLDESMQNITLTFIPPPDDVLDSQESLDWTLVGELQASSGATFHSVSLDFSGDFVATATLDHVQVYQGVAYSWEPFGSSIDASSDKVVISGDGSTLGICVPHQVRLYRFHEDDWAALGLPIQVSSCSSLNFNENGTILAIGDSTADNNRGMVRTYQYISGVWNKFGPDLIGVQEGDMAGSVVALSADGSILSMGLSGATTSQGRSLAGQVKTFRWSHQHDWLLFGSPLTNGDSIKGFGSSISLSPNGRRLAVGAPHGNSIGSSEGEVHVYEWDNDGWILLGNVITGHLDQDQAGATVALMKGGDTIAIGAPGGPYVRVLELDIQNQLWVEIGLFDSSSNGIGLSASMNGVTLAVVGGKDDLYEEDILQLFQ